MELAFDAAILLCQRIYTNAVAASDNISQCRELAEHVQGIEHMLLDMLNDLKMSQKQNQNQNFPPALFSAIEYLKETLEHAGNVIEVYGKRGRLLRYFLATKVQSEFNGAFKRIDDALQRLSAVNVQLVTRVKSQLDDLTINLEAMSLRLSSEMQQITSKLNFIFDKSKNESQQFSFENSLLEVMSKIPDMDPLNVNQQDIDDLVKTKDIIKAEKEELDALMLEQIIAVLQNQQQEQQQYQQQGVYNRQKSIEPPSQIVCPLTLQVMKDPVILHPTGQTYERSDIEHWFERGNKTDPLTGIQIEGEPMLTTNFAVKNMIDDFYSSQNSNQINGQSSKSNISLSQVQDVPSAPDMNAHASRQIDQNGIQLSTYHDYQNDMNNCNGNDIGSQLAVQQNSENCTYYQYNGHYSFKDDDSDSAPQLPTITYDLNTQNHTQINNQNDGSKNLRGIKNIKSWPRWIWVLIIIILFIIIAGSIAAVFASGGGGGGEGEGEGEGEGNTQTPQDPVQIPQDPVQLPPELQQPDPTPTLTPVPLPPKPAENVGCIAYLNRNYCRPKQSGVLLGNDAIYEMEDYVNCLVQYRDQNRCRLVGGSYCKFQTNLSSPDLAPEQCVPNISPSISQLPEADECFGEFEYYFLNCARNTNSSRCPSDCRRIPNSQTYNCVPVDFRNRQQTVDNWMNLLNSNQFSQFQSELESQLIQGTYYCRNVVVPLVVFDLQGKNFTNIGYIAEYFWQAEQDQQKYRGMIDCYSRDASSC